MNTATETPVASYTAPVSATARDHLNGTIGAANIGRIAWEGVTRNKVRSC